MNVEKKTNMILITDLATKDGVVDLNINGSKESKEQ